MTYHLQLANKIRNGYCVGNLWMVVPKSSNGCYMTNVGVYKTEEEARARIAELSTKQ